MSFQPHRKQPPQERIPDDEFRLLKRVRQHKLVKIFNHGDLDVAKKLVARGLVVLKDMAITLA